MWLHSGVRLKLHSELYTSQTGLDNYKCNRADSEDDLPCLDRLMTFNFDLSENLAIGCFMSKKTPFSLISLRAGNNECSKKAVSGKIKLYCKYYKRN
jgi:hypothetical protein